MRCVVTGGSGLIGSSLLPELVAAGWDAHATTRRVVSTGGGVKWHRLNLKEPSTAGLPSRTDAVIYLAQSEHFREFPDKAQSIFDVNVAAVLRFLEYARSAGARSFVLASSGGVYRAGNQDLTEDIDVATRSDLGFYLGTKLCSEILAEQYAEHFTVTILRFFFVYGAEQQQHMLIPRLLRSVKSGTHVKLAGTDGIRINPTHVSDAVAATVRALQLRESHRINVGGPQVVSLRELCEIIGARIGQSPHFDIDPSSVPGHLVANTAKMARLLGPPQITVDNGIDALVSATYPDLPKPASRANDPRVA